MAVALFTRVITVSTLFLLLAAPSAAQTTNTIQNNTAAFADTLDAVFLHLARGGNATDRSAGVPAGGSVSEVGSELCFASALDAFYATTCTSVSQIVYAPDTACSGAGGNAYYCPIHYVSVTGTGTSDGKCYDNAVSVYFNTPCTGAQLQVDYFQTSVCYGASYPAYVYYCPASRANGVIYSSVVSPSTGRTCYLTASVCGAANPGGYCTCSSSMCAGTNGYYAYPSFSQQPSLSPPPPTHPSPTPSPTTQPSPTPSSTQQPSSSPTQQTPSPSPLSSSGGDACRQAVLAQAFSQAFVSAAVSGTAASFSLSDATCSTCGDDNFCPIDDNSFSTINGALFACTSGGKTVSDARLTFQYCKVSLNGGFIAMLIILPLFCIAMCILACCFGCPGCPGHERRNRMHTSVVMAAAQLPMYAQSPVVMVGQPMHAQNGVVYVQPGGAMMVGGSVAAMGVPMK